MSKLLKLSVLSLLLVPFAASEAWNRDQANGSQNIDQNGGTSGPTAEFINGSIGVAAAHHLLASDMGTLRQRLGGAHRVSTAPGGTSPWVRVYGSRWKADSQGRAGFKLDEGVVEVGLDHQFDATLVGAFVDYVHADSKMYGRHALIAGPYKVKSRGGRAGLYVTHNFDSGVWIDVVGRIGFDRNRLRYVETFGSGLKTFELDSVKSVYRNLSVETGRSFGIVDTWRVEPQFQVVFTRSGKVKVLDKEGNWVEAKAHSDVTTRLGALVEKSFTDPSGSDIRAYVKLAWERNWSKAQEVNYNVGEPDKFDRKGNRFIYGLGIEGTLGKKHTWHASVEQSRGGVFRNDVRADLGMRLQF